MFQFRAFPPYTYLIQCTVRGYGPRGFPHSDISGSSDICSSPKLFAACHVLLRLLMPRHSPCALSSLTFLGADCVPARVQAEILGSLELCRHSFRVLQNCRYPHPLGCFHNLLQLARFRALKPSVALLSLHFLFVQFSRCSPNFF